MGAGWDVPSSLRVRGITPGNFFILDARMCSLERIQRIIGIVYEKKLFLLNTYGDRKHAPPSKLERQLPLLLPRHRRPCPVGAWSSLFSLGVRGYYPWENFDLLDARQPRMCILERIQRIIGI